MVGSVFHSAADSYDAMNDFMSAGVHRIWKNYYVSNLGPLRSVRDGEQQRKMKIIDVAGGTGDIAFRMLDKAKKDSKSGLPEVDITVSDINGSMLEVGKKRALE